MADGRKRKRGDVLQTNESKRPKPESLKSSDSKEVGLDFKKQKQRLPSGSSEPKRPQNESFRSNRSMDQPLVFQGHSSQFGGKNPGPLTESLLSDSSEQENEDVEETPSESTSCWTCREVSSGTVQMTCGHRVCGSCLESNRSTAVPGTVCPKCAKKPKEESDKIRLSNVKKSHKAEMRRKFQKTSEGNGDGETSLRSIYTSLYAVTGETDELSGEHELRHLRLEREVSTETSIDLGEIFKPSPNREGKPPRTVLTKGIAGIGKSFSVQKFVLDWAEKKTNRDVDFVFRFAFRELNLISVEINFLKLVTEFHREASRLEDSDLTQTSVVVILDGLDESRLQLDFNDVEPLTSVRDVSSVGKILVNLIRGKLLPDAKLWITSRPAAANQIPAELVHTVTEIRGFSDSQKNEYFTKRFPDSDLAERIRSHVGSSQTLDIMCQIPIFCWISAVLFAEVFSGEEETETPQTLTEMMAHFLFAQTKRAGGKYDVKGLLETSKDLLLKLGKLAFCKLQDNGLIFYEEDLEKYDIDFKEAAVYSGFLNTVLREEKVFSNHRVFSFVHLTVQEFFAALYVYECLATERVDDELAGFLDLGKEEERALVDRLKTIVNKVLEKENGQLDFFLRFLLGLTVEPNRRVLAGLLTPLDPNQEAEKKILTYLRSIRRKTVSPDGCVNLFQSMVEMRDNKVKDEIQEYLKLKDRSKAELTPLRCSALAYMLQISKDQLDELDLKSYNTSEEGRRRLIPAVRCSKKALLNDCKVTEEWIHHLNFGLKFPFSPLRDLDLSDNDLKDAGVKLLCDGLSNQNCRLQILRLSGCLITEKGCSYLVSALQSNPSHLSELDLSYNNPGESERKTLSELKENPKYKLSKLNFEHGGIERMKPGLRKYACKVTFDPRTLHKHLVVSEGNRKVSWAVREQTEETPTRVPCEQSFRQKCYLEVEKGENFSVGFTAGGESWSLSCSEQRCFLRHDDEETIAVPSLCLRSCRLGVFLDWEGGGLSFYKVSNDALSRLHTFRARFTEALRPAVELRPLSSVTLAAVD